jgi:hypothetical protein
MKYIQSNQRWLFLLAFALLLAAVFIQADSAQAVTNKTGGNNANLCMCAIRRPIDNGSTPPPPKAPKPPSQPAPKPPKEPKEPPYVPPAPPPPPAPTACVPAYNAPTMTMMGYGPGFPLVIGQEPDEKGVDVTIMAQGGAKINACPGDPRGTIVTFQLREVNLSPEAIAWINGELRQAYPGAYVKDTYPLHPAPSVSLGSNATMTFHIDPLDPGAYIATVTAVQHDGQTISSDYRIPVHLLEATISW